MSDDIRHRIRVCFSTEPLMIISDFECGALFLRGGRCKERTDDKHPGDDTPRSPNAFMRSMISILECHNTNGISLYGLKDRAASVTIAVIGLL